MSFKISLRLWIPVLTLIFLIQICMLSYLTTNWTATEDLPGDSKVSRIRIDATSKTISDSDVSIENSSKGGLEKAQNVQNGEKKKVTITSYVGTTFNETQKLILLWTKFFGDDNYLTDEHFRDCGVDGWGTSEGTKKPPCIVSKDKHDLPRSDALLFHMMDMNGEDDLPEQRLPHQRYVLFYLENPHFLTLNLQKLNGIINYTATYRRDSDIPLAYGKVGRRATLLSDLKFSLEITGILSHKTNLVTARVSHCTTEHTQRLGYIAELRKYIEVDFYGLCGDKTCPRNVDWCDNGLMKTYKFYLAFENSNCRDYVTEKFWNPLFQWNSVPVVMGGASSDDYAAIAPPHSYINIADFGSPRELADYLRILDNNQTLYAEYFYWRKWYMENRVSSWCRLCQNLHNSSLPVKYYEDLHGWKEEEICYSGD